MPFSLKTVMKINAKVCQPLCSKLPRAEGQSPEREQGVSSKETKTGKPGSGNNPLSAVVVLSQTHLP